MFVRSNQQTNKQTPATQFQRQYKDVVEVFGSRCLEEEGEDGICSVRGDVGQVVTKHSQNAQHIVPHYRDYCADRVH